MTVTVDPAQVGPKQVLAKLEQLGYQASQQGEGSMSIPTVELPPERRRDLAARTNEPDAFAHPKEGEKLQLKIGGMSCSFCVATGAGS